ncbi:MAG: YebC/PmpR family DNA-binding transcriptional regulator [Clostridia bacterium]
MSGHSKWANIKRRKESVDTKRANIFSKIGKEITVAVKSGGSDPSINSKLRDVIYKAKSNNMPNDNINRCIVKASGDTNNVAYEEITYEGFGPFNTNIIVEALTDNKNRAAADIRSIFNKSNGTMGKTGSVSYMFNKRGDILIEKKDTIDSEELILLCIENNAENIIEEEEYYEIICDVTYFNKLKEILITNNYELAEAEIKMIPINTKKLTKEEETSFETFIEKLEENEDVQNIWHNVDI